MKKMNVLMTLAGATIASSAFAAEVSRDEVRAIVAEALADANTRTSLLQGGGSAGYDRGFYVGSPNGDWKMNVNGMIQFRFDMNKRKKANLEAGTPNDDFVHEFDMRRIQLNFNGTIVNPNLSYCIRLVDDFSGNQHVTFDDAYMCWNYGNGWKIKGGQFKGAFLKESSNSDSTTTLAERGVMSGAFNPGRTQGISAMYDGGEWRGVIEFTDGFNTSGTPFGTGTAEFAFTGRLDWLFTGKWDAMRDYTSKVGDANSGYVGAAIHWEESARNLAGFGVNRFFGWTVDSQWEGNGWGLFGAIAGAHGDPAAPGINTTDFGACVQGSYRWDEPSEIFARWDGLFLDKDRALPKNNYHFLTVGYNNYYAGNNAKFTLQATVALTRDDGLFGLVPGAGDPVSPTRALFGKTKSGEIGVIAQWQLMF